jgi:hypothetical protein
MRLATINNSSPLRAVSTRSSWEAGRVPEVDDAITEMGKWLRRRLLLRATP